jgi:integrase
LLLQLHYGILLRSWGRFRCTNQTTPQPTNFNTTQPNSILSYAWQLQKDGKAEETVQTALLRLKRIASLTNINDPEQVKATLATLKWKNSSKRQVAVIYTGYLKYIGKTWNAPKYMKENPIAFIPTEQEIDSLISAGRTRTSAFLQLLKETGARMGEAMQLKWIDIDEQRRTIHITAEKGSNDRILPISNRLIGMLNQLPKKNDKVFITRKHSLRVTFEKLRERTATKLNNPRLNAIHLHTFRHWKGTMEYHKTKDIIHVKTILGHKKIETTMIYINLENAIFSNDDNEYTCKATKDTTEATKLIEIGFQYVTTTPDNLMLFRKRK